MTSIQSRQCKLWLLLAITLAGVAGVMALPPIAQDMHYHLFADQEAWLGVPNFWNVVSNLPFIAVGLYGLWRQPLHVSAALAEAYVVLCVFVTLLGLGSAWYHFAPTTHSLLGDRLPMSGAFMSLFVCLLIDAVSSRARTLLIPFVLTGLASVGYWFFTELEGRGDLRPYALVQFLPLVLFPLLLLMFGTKELRARMLWLTLGGYVLAKITEHFDRELYTTLGVLSGHSLKHMIAAAAILCALCAFRAPSENQ